MSRKNEYSYLDEAEIQSEGMTQTHESAEKVTETSEEKAPLLSVGGILPYQGCCQDAHRL